ncbi:MAG: branched-chain amino acid transport system II carrier protein [Hyphomicrobiales bacterium]
MPIKGKTKHITKILIAGFALFSLFFGAGNLIFPPELGFSEGHHWYIGTIGFFLTDLGLSVLTLIAIIGGGGTFSKVLNQVSPSLSKFLTTIVILFIGPLVGMPRILALIYEIGIQPIFPHFNKILALVIVCLFIYWAVMHPKNLINLIGKYLTPILLISLLVFIIAGIIKEPRITSIAPVEQHPFSYGLLQGYQTLDIMGAAIFASIFSKKFAEEKLTNRSAQVSYILKASIVALILMLVIYGGLAYLGAAFRDNFTNGAENVEILVGILKLTLGVGGLFVLSIIVITACFTTVIGLTLTASEYFTKTLNNRVKYKAFIIINLVVALFVAHFGVQPIIDYSLPFIKLFYPTIIIIVVSQIFRRYLWDLLFMKIAIIISLLFGIPRLLVFFTIIPTSSSNFTHDIPLYSSNLEWLIPVVIVGVIVKFIYLLKRK